MLPVVGLQITVFMFLYKSGKSVKERILVALPRFLFGFFTMNPTILFVGKFMGSTDI